MEIKVEVWKDINDFPNYQVSNFGRIKSKERFTRVGIRNVKYILRKEKILKPLKITNGYLGIRLYNGENVKTFKIHRLVANHFIPNPKNYPQVNHIDGNKLNNHIENLEFCSHKHNMQEAWNLNLISRCHKKGKEHHRSITVLQYDINGNFIKEWECIRQVEKELGICHQNISKCCKGKYKTCGGYIWKYKHHQEVHNNKHKWQPILKEMNK